MRKASRLLAWVIKRVRVTSNKIGNTVIFAGFKEMSIVFHFNSRCSYVMHYELSKKQMEM